MWKKKNINKIIIWAFLWTAIWWLWFLSRTKKWKTFFRKMQDDVKLGLKDMQQIFQNLIKKNVKKKK